MKRLSIVAYVALFMGISMSCGGNDSTTDSPQAAAIAFVEAYFNADVDGIMETVHISDEQVESDEIQRQIATVRRLIKREPSDIRKHLGVSQSVARGMSDRELLIALLKKYLEKGLDEIDIDSTENKERRSALIKELKKSEVIIEDDSATIRVVWDTDKRSFGTNIVELKLVKVDDAWKFDGREQIVAIAVLVGARQPPR